MLSSGTSSSSQPLTCADHQARADSTVGRPGLSNGHQIRGPILSRNHSSGLAGNNNTNRRAHENLWIPPTLLCFCVSRSCPCLGKAGRLWTWSPGWTTLSRSAAPACTILRCGAAGVKVTTSSWTVRTLFPGSDPELGWLLVRRCEPASGLANVDGECWLVWLQTGRC